MEGGLIKGYAWAAALGQGRGGGGGDCYVMSARSRMCPNIHVQNTDQARFKVQSEIGGSLYKHSKL